MAANREELLKAIRAKANGNSALSTAVDSDVFFDHAPAGTTMPYLVYHLITDVPIDHFADEVEDVTVQFTVFDDRPGVANVEAVTSDLDLAFNRQELTYDTASHVGCIRSGGTGPEWAEDDRVWMRTVDYRILFEHP